MEEFQVAVQEATNFPLRSNVVPFLKSHVPVLQREINLLSRASKQVSIILRTKTQTKNFYSSESFFLSLVVEISFFFKWVKVEGMRDNCSVLNRLPLRNLLYKLSSNSSNSVDSQTSIKQQNKDVCYCWRRRRRGLTRISSSISSKDSFLFQAKPVLGTEANACWCWSTALETTTARVPRSKTYKTLCFYFFVFVLASGFVRGNFGTISFLLVLNIWKVS